jgi:predicted acyl esterase
MWISRLSRLATICAMLLAIPIAWLALAVAQQPDAQTQMVAMSDGVKLATDVYLPKGDGPFPTILMRTP